LQVVQLAYEDKHDNMLQEAARFIRNNAKEFVGRIKWRELDPDLEQTLLDSIFKAI